VTEAIDRQAVAAERNAAVLQRVNQTTGIDRGNGAEMADLAAQLREESDARDRNIQKMRAEEAAAAELARTKEAAARASTFLPGNAATGKSARDSASVFQEADAQAAKRFENQLEQNTRRTREMDTAAAKLRAELNPLAAIQDKLNAELAEANALYKVGKASDLGKQFLQNGRQLNEAFANQGANAIDRFAEQVANGTNVFHSLKDAFLQFAADFLCQLVDMIAKQALFNALGGANGSGNDGFGGAVIGAIGSIFHDGGIAGLRPNEVSAILEEGEEVLKRSDPRHVLNGGGGPQAVNLHNVNVFDASDVLQKAVATRVGEKVLLNFVSANSRAIKSALG
jgi:hypothetical protein